MKIILASGSPRRKEILENVGVEFEVVVSEIEEDMSGDDPKTVVRALAFEKAHDVSKKVAPGQLIIASDTIVYCDEILGKPADEADAIRVLSKLRNRSHQVYTGICVYVSGTNEKYVDVVETTVYTKNYSDEKIKRYIETGEVWGKAGSYAIQGYGATLVDHIDGDYLNIVGLPLSKLEDMLSERFGITFL